MAKRVVKFPPLLHVVEENSGTEDAFFRVVEGGVEEVDVNGQEVAIYQRTKVGSVSVKRTFVEGN